jgi:DNA-binding NarL/FixJ family response regulator
MSDSTSVLIVEDDAAFGTFLQTLLVGAGFRCRCAVGGAEGLAAAELERPQLVLLDVQLPAMSGYEVCRRLRERYGRAVGVVFLSGERIELYDQVAGLELGGDDYLVKPPDEGVLIARLHALARRLRQDGERPPSALLRPPAALAPAPAQTLTVRELEVLGLAATGLAQKQIAQRLSISRKTVGSHLEHIFRKLDVHSQGEAVAAARERRLLPDQDGAAGGRRRGYPAVTAAMLGLAGIRSEAASSWQPA